MTSFIRISSLVWRRLTRESSLNMSAGDLTASDCPPVKPLDLSQESLHSDEVDHFTLSRETVTEMCFSPDLQLSLEGGKFKFKSLTERELRQPENKVTVNVYKSTTLDRTVGRPVMLSIKDNNQKMVLTCSNKRKVKPKAMVPPQDIHECTSDALFILSEVEGQSKKYKLESHMYKKRFLTCKRNKLVLGKIGKKVNEKCQFSLFQ